MKDIYSKLVEIIDKNRIFQNEMMKKHTSFKIGGPADFFIIIESVEELKAVLKFAKELDIPVTCIGNGSNLLIKDNGIRGLTIKLDFKDLTINEDEIEAGAGVPIPVLARKAYENGLSGLEFASGIPGTLGGAIKINAGAYGGEFKDVVDFTTYLDNNLQVHTVSNEDQNFSYRNSRFNNTDDIIISAKMKLKKENKDIIKAKMDELSAKRKDKQPINFPNAGSVFKRKNEYIAAEVIDKCGLKGYNIGDAYISDLHAGFIVNKGNATAQDVIQLIEYIKNTVHEKYNINLELEIKVIGE
jgi:UDP-N-acetylmuramate dehydrogenase